MSIVDEMASACELEEADVDLVLPPLDAVEDGGAATVEVAGGRPGLGFDSSPLPPQSTLSRFPLSACPKTVFVGALTSTQTPCNVR